MCMIFYYTNTLLSLFINVGTVSSSRPFNNTFRQEVFFTFSAKINSSAKYAGNKHTAKCQLYSKRKPIFSAFENLLNLVMLNEWPSLIDLRIYIWKNTFFNNYGTCQTRFSRVQNSTNCDITCYPEDNVNISVNKFSLSFDLGI